MTIASGPFPRLTLAIHTVDEPPIYFTFETAL